MYIGTVLVPATGTGTDEDPQRPDITLPNQGEKWTDVQAAPSDLYISPLPGLLIEVTAELSTFQALEADSRYHVFNYDEEVMEV